jgi:hypothetical protein
MSEENVEIVRRAHEVWNAGNMDTLRELYDTRASSGVALTVGRSRVLMRVGRRSWARWSRCATPGTPTALN